MHFLYLISLLVGTRCRFHWAIYIGGSEVFWSREPRGKKSYEVHNRAPEA